MAIAKRSKPALRLAGRGGRARKVNASRKQIMAAQRAAWQLKQQKVEAAKAAEKQARVQQLQRVQNKKTNKLFDRTVLHAVQEGLTAAITALHEPVTPLSLFMAALTAASRAPERHHIPYLLALLSVCAPRLSQGVLTHQLEPVLALCEQLLAEYSTSNTLITSKAMKLAQTMLLCLEVPSVAHVKSYARLRPSKTRAETMKMYLETLRKLLEQAALRPTSDGKPRRKEGYYYTLTPSQQFYCDALPLFVHECVENLLETPNAVAMASMHELQQLFQRSLSPYIVESAQGSATINGLLSGELLALLKPVYQTFWAVALELLETLFSRLNYLKRVAAPNSNNGEKETVLRFTERFPAVPFLLQVLDKLRRMDDAQMNGRVERAMVAIGAGMTMREFVTIVTFDPRAAFEAEARGEAELATRLWSTSYLLNVMRRIADHDSLPFLIEHFFPMIQFCSKAAVQAERAAQSDEFTRWSALLLQLWRITVGFCHYPLEVTDSAFREMAKQLVGLLGSAAFTDTSATAIHVLCSGYYALASTEDNTDIESDDEEEREGEEKPVTKTRPTRKEGLEEDDVFLAMNDPTWDPHRYHNITAATARAVCEKIFAKYSANIMPRLSNTFERHDSTAVLLAIQSFSRVCSATVMTSILDRILDMGASLVTESADTNNDSNTTASLASKRRVALDIACAVVAQLSREQLVRLFECVVEPVLTDPTPHSRLLQKKAYKLLYAMFEHRIRDIFTLFPRIVGLLSIGRQHVTISGMKMRLRCLAWALDACKMFYPQELPTTIRSTVAEVVLFSRERASETRAKTMEMMEKMQRYLVASGAPCNALLHLVLAGLAGKTAMMIAGSLVCVAKLVHLTQDELPEEDLRRVVAIGFRLMESDMGEVRAAAAVFARMVLKLAKRNARVHDAVAHSLPALLRAIALVTSQPAVSSTARTQMRVLLEKCIKRFGYDRLDPIFPIGSKNFLRYTHKMLRHEEKKAEQALKQRNARQQNAFDKLFLGAAMNAGSVTAAEEDLLQAGALTSFVARHTTPLSAMTSRLLSGQTNNNKEDNEEDEYDTMHLSFDEGKLRIVSHEEKMQAEAQRQRQELADRLLRRQQAVLNADTVNTGVSRPGKRKRDELEDLENEQLILRYGAQTPAPTAATLNTAAASMAATTTLGRRGVSSVVGPSAQQTAKLREQKAIRRELKRQRVESDIRKGDEFVGRGAGDVKRGNLEPFAYVPLNRRYMNRRHSRQALHRFEVIANTQLKGEKAKQTQKRKNAK